jgi:hypothetical protein
MDKKTGQIGERWYARAELSLERGTKLDPKLWARTGV